MTLSWFIKHCSNYALKPEAGISWFFFYWSVLFTKNQFVYNTFCEVKYMIFSYFTGVKLVNQEDTLKLWLNSLPNVGLVFFCFVLNVLGKPKAQLLYLQVELCRWNIRAETQIIWLSKEFQPECCFGKTEATDNKWKQKHKRKAHKIQLLYVVWWWPAG